VHLAGFAPAFTLSLCDSEYARKPPVPIASVVMGHFKKKDRLMKLKKILFILFIFPTIIVGQNNDLKLDSIFNMNSIDASKRPVYLNAETNPTLINGEKIETYF
jgi:hypothetical protein